MKTMKISAPRFLPFVISVVSDADFHSSFCNNLINCYEITLKEGWMEGWIDGWMNGMTAS